MQSARALAPRVTAAAAQIERERRLPEPLVRSLAEAGLFRMLVPRRFGGSETDLLTYVLAIEEIAKADGSTAWCLNQAAASARIIPRLPPETAAAIFGDVRGVISWGQGTGSAVPVVGGYRLTGSWSFASGSHHATWLGGYATLDGSGGATSGTDAPDIWMLLFPRDRAAFDDVWRVSGLRGTGSDTFAVSDLFVPGACATNLSAPEPPGNAPLIAFPQVIIYAIGFAAVALGIARSVVDAFGELARAKRPRGAKFTLRDNPVVQSQTGKIEASLLSVREFLHAAIAGAWRSACEGRALSPRERVLLRLASTHAIQTAADVVNTVYRAAGATAIFDGNAFERRFRDVHAVTQQIQGSPLHYETAGRFFLGLDTDSGWL